MIFARKKEEETRRKEPGGFSAVGGYERTLSHDKDLVPRVVIIIGPRSRWRPPAVSDTNPWKADPRLSKTRGIRVFGGRGMRSTAGKNHRSIADKVGFAPTESRDNTPPAATRVYKLSSRAGVLCDRTWQRSTCGTARAINHGSTRRDSESDDREKVPDNIYYLFTHTCNHRFKSINTAINNLNEFNLNLICARLERFLRSTNGIRKLKRKVRLQFDPDR